MRNETTRQAWEIRLREQAASGLGIKTWCAQEGLAASSFHYWRKQLAPPSSSATKLIALPLLGGQVDPALELRTPQGYLIRLSSLEQVGWLGGVLEALR
jgi:hypothetical protein